MLGRSIRSDLSEIVDDREEMGVFRPGKAVMWSEDIEEAEYVLDLLMVNEAMGDTLADHEEFQQYVERDTNALESRLSGDSLSTLYSDSR